MRINAIFQRKEPSYEPSACEVEKIIVLPEDRFLAFRRNLQADQDFISDNADLMKTGADEVEHCILVLGEGSDDGILVDSFGTAHAKFSAFISGARQLLAFEEQRAE